MTWTYTADPTSSKKDAVRFLVGDTNDSDQLITDEEINWSLTEVNYEPYRAASNVAYTIASIFARQAQQLSKTVGGLTISQSFADRGQRYERMAEDLLRRSRRINPPLANADPGALGAEFLMGEFDRYYAVANDWPSGSVTGVTSTYGTGFEPGSQGEISLGIEPYEGNNPGDAGQ